VFWPRNGKCSSRHASRREKALSLLIANEEMSGKNSAKCQRHVRKRIKQGEREKCWENKAGES